MRLPASEVLLYILLQAHSCFLPKLPSQSLEFMTSLYIVSDYSPINYQPIAQLLISLEDVLN